MLPLLLSPKVESKEELEFDLKSQKIAILGALLVICTVSIFVAYVIPLLKTIFISA